MHAQRISYFNIKKKSKVGTREKKISRQGSRACPSSSRHSVAGEPETRAYTSAADGGAQTTEAGRPVAGRRRRPPFQRVRRPDRIDGRPWPT